MTSGSRRVRVLHFVTGGFSGAATQVAIQLVNAVRASAAIEPKLVLRRKRHAGPARIEELRRAGVPLARVSHLVHVEHNTRERCTAWQRQAPTRWLLVEGDALPACADLALARDMGNANRRNWWLLPSKWTRTCTN